MLLRFVVGGCLSEGYYSMETGLLMYFRVFLIYFVLACLYLSSLYQKFPPFLKVHRLSKREHPAQSFEWKKSLVVRRFRVSTGWLGSASLAGSS